MTFALASQFHFYCLQASRSFSQTLIPNIYLLTFNQEMALLGAFSVIVKSSGTFGKPSFEALVTRLR